MVYLFQRPLLAALVVLVATSCSPKTAKTRLPQVPSTPEAQTATPPVNEPVVHTTPTPTPTPTVTPTSTPTPIATREPEPVAAPTPTSTPTLTPVVEPSVTPSVLPSVVPSVIPDAPATTSATTPTPSPTTDAPTLETLAQDASQTPTGTEDTSMVNELIAPPPPSAAVTSVASSSKGTTLLDTKRIFQCSRVIIDANGKRKTQKFDADYDGCEFRGPLGEEWHALFPAHPATGDETCKIAYTNQRTGNCLTCFPTPPSCRTTNEVASLESADSPGTAIPGKSNSYAARAELILRAKKSIRMQYYIWYGDESGWALADLLIARKRQDPKLDIRVTVDMSNALTPGRGRAAQQMYYNLQQHGIAVVGYEPGGTAILNEAFNFGELDLRWHDKMMAVDAEDPDNGYAIVGGQNVANEYFRLGFKQKEIWRDEDVIVRGPIVRDVAKSFDNNQTHLEKLRDTRAGRIQDNIWKSIQASIARLNPNDPATLNNTLSFGERTKLGLAMLTGDDVKYVWDWNYSFNDKWEWDGTPQKSVVTVKFSPDFEPKAKAQVDTLLAEVKSNHSQGRSLIERLKFHQGDMRWFNQHPRYGETYINQSYVDLIKNAKESIYLVNAYFVPDPDYFDSSFIKELKIAAGQRCVAVKVLTNSLEASDNTNVHVIGRSFYKELIEVNRESRKNCGGKDLFHIIEWHGQRHGEYTNHSKYGIFDRKNVLVGSFNLDPRSVSINSETALVLHSPELAAEMLEQIEKRDIPVKSEWITWEKAVEWFSPQKAKERLNVFLRSFLRSKL